MKAKGYTDMHHFRITLSVTPIEEIQHFLLKLLAILVDIFSGLLQIFV